MSRIEKALDKLAQRKEAGGREEEKAKIRETLSRETVDSAGPEAQGDHGYLDPLLLALHQPFSLVSEQFKSLRTHLLRIRNKHKHNLFLVTSTVGKEGKSMVSLNLAISIAQGFNEQVLLVECDFRKPRLASMLGLEANEGLAEYIQGQPVANGLLRPSGVEKLTVIPAGNPPSYPAELLGSSRFDSLLRELKRSDQNRIVLVDSPPLIPVTDTAILAPKVDGIVLVVQAYKTQKDAIEKALSSVDGAPVVGVVLNQVPINETLSYFPKYYYDGDYAAPIYSDNDKPESG